MHFNDGTVSGTPLSVRVYSDVNRTFTTFYQNYETKLGVDMSLAEDLFTKPIYCHEYIIVQLFTQNLRNIRTKIMRCDEADRVDLVTDFIFGIDRLPFNFRSFFNLDLISLLGLHEQFSIFDVQDTDYFGDLQESSIAKLGALKINSEL